MNEREQEWKDGMHTGSSGQTNKLSDLPTRYLQNIVNKYGADNDVSPVEKEINSRPAEDTEQK